MPVVICSRKQDGPFCDSPSPTPARVNALRLPSGLATETTCFTLKLPVTVRTPNAAGEDKVTGGPAPPQCALSGFREALAVTHAPWGLSASAPQHGRPISGTIPPLPSPSLSRSLPADDDALLTENVMVIQKEVLMFARQDFSLLPSHVLLAKVWMFASPTKFTWWNPKVHEVVLEGGAVAR